jgi:cytochrome P450
MVSMGAANRDPEAFPNPDQIQLGRDNAIGSNLRHMTFGTGRHRCLGAVMAQTNLPLMLRALIDRVGHFEVDRAAAVRLATFEVRAFEHLPIQWKI